MRRRTEQRGTKTRRALAAIRAESAKILGPAARRIAVEVVCNWGRRLCQLWGIL